MCRDRGRIKRTSAGHKKYNLHYACCIVGALFHVSIFYSDVQWNRCFRREERLETLRNVFQWILTMRSAKFALRNTRPNESAVSRWKRQHVRVQALLRALTRSSAKHGVF